jgi:hypothetical protein
VNEDIKRRDSMEDIMMRDIVEIESQGDSGLAVHIGKAKGKQGVTLTR